MLINKIATVLIIIFIILIIFIVIFFIGTQEKNVILVNWGVSLPKPQKTDRIIYRHGIQDGEVLEIYNYTPKTIGEVIKSEYFTQISNLNKEFLENTLNDYCNMLSAEDRTIFNKNINISSLITEENYFSYITNKTDEKTYLLLIVDFKNSKMYCLENVF